MSMCPANRLSNFVIMTCPPSLQVVDPCPWYDLGADYPPMAYADLREYLAALERTGKLFRVQAEVDNEWEVAAVTRRVFQRIPERDRPGLLFEHVKGFDMPVTVGILGASREGYATALHVAVEDVPDVWAEAQQHPLPPEEVATGPVKENRLLG